MLASNMKILKLNANNASPAVIQEVGVGAPTTPKTTIFKGSNSYDGCSNKESSVRIVNGGVESSSSICYSTNHKSNKQRESNEKNNKTKFENRINNVKLQQKQQQQQRQQQKFHHNNNNSNSNSGNRFKKQQFSNQNSNNNNKKNCNTTATNSNYNSYNNSSSINHKKFYQQPHNQYQYQQQQQQYLKNINTQQEHQEHLINITLPSTVYNSNNNSSSSLAKNHSYTTRTTHSVDLLIPEQKQQQQYQEEHTNADKSTSTKSYTTPLEKVHTLTAAESSSLSSTKIIAYQQTLNTYTSTLTPVVSLSSTNLSELSKTIITTSAKQEFVVASAAVATSTITPTTTAKTTSSCTKAADTIATKSSCTYSTPSSTTTAAISLSLVTKKKLCWKNSNSIEVVGGGRAIGSTSLSKTQPQIVTNNKVNRLLTKDPIVNTGASTNDSNSGNSNCKTTFNKSNNNNNINDQKNCKNSEVVVNGVSTTNISLQQRDISKLKANQFIEKRTMSTTIRGNSEEPAVAIKKSISNSSPSTSINYKNGLAVAAVTAVSSPLKKQQQGVCDKKNDTKQQMLKTLNSHNSNCKSESNNNNSTTNINSSSSLGGGTAKTLPSITTTKSLSSSSLPNNSYSLDFLHSVGVKMTGATMRSSQGTPYAYAGDNQFPLSSQVHNNSSYANGMSTDHQRQQRYVYGPNNNNNTSTGNGGGGSIGSGHHHYHQQQHYYHHQPKQLTIASFLKNDLLLETVNSSGVGGGRNNGNSSTARNTKNYNNDQQQQRTSHNQRYHHSCYTSSPYHQRQQHQNQPLIMSHTNYMSSGCAARKLNYTGDMNRLLGSSTGNGGVVGSTGQRSCVSYPGYHNFVSSDEVGISRTNSIQSTIFPSQQQQSNAENASAPLSNNTSVNNKRSYASSTASSCSTASSKSLSSNSSKNSGRQFASYKPSVIKQKSVKNSTNLNLVIETLPAKSFVGHGSNQRVSHNRGQHHIYNNRRQHHYSLNSGGAGGGGGSANHHHNQHLLISSPNLLQHQNYYNLKYVSTDGFVSSGGTTSRGCSPPPPPVVPASTAATNHSPKTVESSPAGTVAMLMSFNTNELQYPRYSTAHHLADQHQQFYQYQQQHVQQNFLNKKLMSPLTLTMPSLSHSLTSACNTSAVSLNAREQPTPTSAAVLQNIISSSKLDKVVATATSSPTSTIIANNNYDSDSSLNHSCTPQTNEYNSLKSSLSLSSTTSSSCVTSASTGSSLTQQNFSQPATPSSVGAPRTLLQSPLNCNYSRGGGGMDMQQHTFTEIQDYHRAEQQQHNTHQLNNSEKKVIQEFPQIYQNISEDHDSTLLNLPAQLPDNFSGNECQNQKQQQYQQQQQPPQQHEFYFNSAASNDYINAAASLVTNRSNINCNYWNPLYHGSQLLHRNFASAQMALLPPPPLPVTSSLPSSCGSSSASMSPMLHSNSDHILTEGGIGMQQQQHLHKNIIATAASSSSSSSPSSNNLNEQFCHLVIDTNNFGNDSGLVVGVGAAVAPSSCNSNSSNSTTAGSTCGSNGNGNSINSINVGSDHKWGSSQLLMQQHQHFIAQQQQQNTHQGSSSFTSASTLTNTVRVRGGCTCNTNNNQIQKQADSSTITSNVVSANGGSHLQQQPTQHLYTRHQQQQKSLPTPPPLPPPHNQLFNNPPTHHLMRALSSSLSITQSVYDFAHTPPDRFLARAHLTEVKETPPTLLNKTKWDNLSQSIWTKFVTSQQTGETFKQKMLLWRYLFIYIKNSPFARFGIYLVGSTISGFGSDSSDVDMCLVSRITPHVEPRSEALYTLTSLREWLSKSGEFEHFNLIEAKVPILRFRDRLNQFEIDLNYNNCVGISNTHLLYCYSQLDWRLRPLVLVTKLWAQYHNINNAKNMTISSYSLVLMVIHFLQYAVDPPVLPCLHKKHPDKFQPLRSNEFNHVDMNETIGGYESKNSQTIGELFLYFLRYYSCFDYTQYAISVRTGGVLPIDSCRKVKSLKNDIHQWKELCIEEPFDYTNTARSVYDYKTFERVKGVFIASWHILEETLDLNSVFSPITLSPLTAAVNGSDGCECEATTFESSNTTATAITITTAVVNANTVVSPQLYTTVNPSLSKDFSFTSISGNYENNNSLNDKSSMDVTNVNRCSDADNDDVKDNYTAKTTNNLQVSKCKDHNTITRCAGDSKEYQQQMIKQKEKVQKQQQLPSSYNLVSSLNSLNYIKSNTKNKCNKNSTATDASKIS